MSIAIENTTPGVTVLVNQGQVSRPLERQPTSTFFAVGATVWGPINVPTVVTSWAEFTRFFGGLHNDSYLASAAYIFFNLFGGKRMVVVRVVGSNAQPGILERNDRGVIPKETLRIIAKYASSVVDILVAIENGSIAGSVKLTFKSVYLGVTEVFDNFKMDTASLALVNLKSKLVELQNLGSPNAAPTNLPVNTSGVALPFGNEDFIDVAEGLSSGLITLESENFGTGQIATPGFSNINAVLRSHAERFKRLAILEPSLAASVQEAVEMSNDARSAYAALYYPWVQMNDLAGSGLKKFYPPSAFAAGACAQVDRTIGIQKAPANIVIPNALDVERNSDGSALITDAAREFLNSKQVNVIAPLQGEGIKIYGARVLYPAGETRVRFVHEQRILNLIYYTAKIGFSWAVFATVDGQGRLFRDLRASATTFLRNLWRAGALYGKTEKDAFTVICDETNNPADELEQGRVHIQLGVKLSPTAEQIFINIDNVPLLQNLNVLNGGEN